MADVTVEFGAKDLGLAKTLATVQSELTNLRSKVKTGDLSISDLEQTMRRVGQVESMEKRIKGMGQAADSATADFKQLDAAIDSVQAEQAATGFGSITSGIGKMAASITAAYAAVQGFAASFKFVGDAVIAASDLGETTSKVGQIFGTSAGEIEKWAKTSATALGQSSKQAMDAAATFGIFGKAAGLSGNALAGFSTDLTGLATDLASFNNTSPEEAILAIGAALRGESEPIRRFGVLLDDATLKAKAMEMGLYDGTGSLDLQARSLAAYNVILDQTTTQQGDFARTADGMANQTRILEAEVENLKAELGTGLLPAATSLVSYLNDTAVPAVYGLKAAFEEAVLGAKSLANSLGFSDDALRGAKKSLDDAAPALKTTLGSALPLAGAFFKAGDALEFLAEKGREARGETEKTADKQDALGTAAGGAAQQLDASALAVAAAAGSYKAAGKEAESAGQFMADSFSLGADFKPTLDGLSDGWSDVSSEIAGQKSLLSDNYSLTDSISGKTDEQAQSLGGVNEQLKLSSQLTGEVEKKIEETNKKVAEADSKQAEKNQKKQEELALDLKIAEAIAGGNEEQAKALQSQKDFNRYLNEAISAGMGKPEAEQFAAAMAKAAGSAKNVKEELSASAKLMQSIAEARANDAVDRAGRNQARAQEALARGDFAGAERAARRIAEGETEARLRGVGENRDRRAIADIGREIGLSRQSNETSSEFSQRILDVREGRATADKFGRSTPVDKPGQTGRTREEARSGGGKSTGKSTLETLVDDIKKLVEKIEPKLPTNALMA